MVIKETLGLTDEETVEQIRENPYLQYFLGYKKHTEEKPFDPSFMVMDATCVPADIRYPTDLSLLNEARGNTEVFIDILYEPLKGEIDKPRGYRRIARADYLATAKMRRPR